MKRILSLVALIAMVTGCSSGGGSGSSVPAQTPAKTAPQSVGTTTLTIKFPASFGHVLPAGVKGARPKFVNPTITNFLDVYVDQILVLLPSGLPNDTVQINSTNPDGTQTLSIPQYSTGINDVLVIERDPANNLLALGQANANGVGASGPGFSNSASINMAMNLASFAYSTDGINAIALASETVCVGTSPGSTPIQFVGVDPSGGFTLTSNAGVGGLAALTVLPSAISPTVSPPSNIASTLAGSYSLIYDSGHTGPNDGVQVSVLAANPANSVYQGLESGDLGILSNYGGPSPSATTQRVDGVDFFPNNNNAECT
jgi:hypothetical protein